MLDKLKNSCTDDSLKNKRLADISRTTCRNLVVPQMFKGTKMWQSYQTGLGFQHLLLRWCQYPLYCRPWSFRGIDCYRNGSRDTFFQCGRLPFINVSGEKKIFCLKKDKVCSLDLWWIKSLDHGLHYAALPERQLYNIFDSVFFSRSSSFKKFFYTGLMHFNDRTLLFHYFTENILLKYGIAYLSTRSLYGLHTDDKRVILWSNAI